MKKKVSDIQSADRPFVTFGDKVIDAIKQIADRSHTFECDKLLISLNQDFYNDPEFQVLLDTVDRGTILDTNDIKIASRYLDFFEPFYFLIKRGYLKIEQVDDMFAYRFFAIVNNPTIQNALIDQHFSYYGNICRLHNIWIKHRESKQRKQLPLPNTDISRYDWYDEMSQDV